MVDGFARWLVLEQERDRKEEVDIAELARVGGWEAVIAPRCYFTVATVGPANRPTEKTSRGALNVPSTRYGSRQVSSSGHLPGGTTSHRSPPMRGEDIDLNTATESSLPPNHLFLVVIQLFQLRRTRRPRRHRRVEPNDH